MAVNEFIALGTVHLIESGGQDFTVLPSCTVTGAAQTWDKNGNLTQDNTGATYTYDSANRLKTVTQGSTVSSYVYNGLGDRLSQTVNGVTTTYTLDLNAGLTQVLTDGTNTYLYGNTRIAQSTTSGMQYFAGDALGSVRQLTNSSGVVALTRSYEPYGTVLSSAGVTGTAYGYVGEWTDGTGLVHLRARYYAPSQGRFLTADAWPGDELRPQTLNGWGYVEGNPINRVDPSGYQTLCIPLSSGYCQPVDPSVTGAILSGVSAAVVTVTSAVVACAATVVCVAAVVVGGIVVITVISSKAPSPPQVHTPAYPPAPPTTAPPTSTPYPDTRTGTGEDPFRLPYQYRATCNAEPGPNPTPTKLGPDIIVRPTGTPEPKRKDISLGRNEWLWPFTNKLNEALNPQNIYVYMSGDWFDEGLSDTGAGNPFGPRFQQAIERARHIHFNLEGIPDPNQYAETYGNSGVFGGGGYYTATELFIIKHNGWCHKTSFYENGSIIPSASAKSSICGNR